MAALRRLGVQGVEIRKPEQLNTISSLIIPGGESTTMAKLAEYHNLVAFFTSFVFIFMSLFGNTVIRAGTPRYLHKLRPFRPAIN